MERELLPPLHPYCRCVVVPDGLAPQTPSENGEAMSSAEAYIRECLSNFLDIPSDARDLFLSFWLAQLQRYNQGTFSGKLDYLTLGMVSGFFDGLTSRTLAVRDDPSFYTIGNWLTLGLFDLVKGAVFPERPLSLEHILDSLGFYSAALSAYYHAEQGLRNLRASKIVKEAEERAARRLSSVGGKLSTKVWKIRTKVYDYIEEVKQSDYFLQLSKTQQNRIIKRLKHLGRGNAAVAEVFVHGAEGRYYAYSQINAPNSPIKTGNLHVSYLPDENHRIFKSYEIVDNYTRYHDTEAKILEDVASRITDPNVKGEINLFTELDACQSCLNIMEEFRRMFPNIKLNVFSNNSLLAEFGG